VPVSTGEKPLARVTEWSAAPGNRQRHRTAAFHGLRGPVCVEPKIDHVVCRAHDVDVAATGETALIKEVQERLALKYAQLPPDSIAAAVAQAHARFQQSRVRDFIPLLVERHAGQVLSGQAHTVPGAV
jgi:hypothetical protein